MKKTRLPLIKHAFPKVIKTKEALAGLTSFSVMWDDVNKITIWSVYFTFTYSIRNGAKRGLFELDSKGNKFKNESKLKNKLYKYSRKQLGL